MNGLVFKYATSTNHAPETTLIQASQESMHSLFERCIESLMCLRGLA